MHCQQNEASDFDFRRYITVCTCWCTSVLVRFWKNWSGKLSWAVSDRHIDVTSLKTTANKFDQSRFGDILLINQWSKRHVFLQLWLICNKLYNNYIESSWYYFLYVPEILFKLAHFSPAFLVFVKMFSKIQTAVSFFIIGSVRIVICCK